MRGLVPWKLRGKSKYAGSVVSFCFTSLPSIDYDTRRDEKCVCFELIRGGGGGGRDVLAMRRFFVFVFAENLLTMTSNEVAV